MWAQEWGNLYSRVAPFPNEPSIDVTDTMKAQGWTINRMVQTADDFYVSIGMDRMTKTFWKLSLFDRPQDREVVCHASANDFFKTDDYR